MKYVVIQERGATLRAGGRACQTYTDVASFSEAEDAILFAEALSRQQWRGVIQAWAKNKNRHAFSLLCLVQPDERSVSEARAHWPKQLKDWRAEQRLLKRSLAIRNEFAALLASALSANSIAQLRADDVFKKAYWACPPRIDEAYARATELGFVLREAAVAA